MMADGTTMGPSQSSITEPSTWDGVCKPQPRIKWRAVTSGTELFQLLEELRSKPSGGC
ncbi:hypothetical protein MalM25_20360 [Planctomycetes bacterium MalM25]|nr:hypothetical protein MalM25_20360 [Planctomycetes bacterium MalM25]